jgi:excinuclease ABC subunit C
MPFNPTQFLKTAPTNPGVYRMYDTKGKIIYVGKAKNLKKRLQSYFRKNIDSAKTQLVVSKIADIQVTVTHSENEALILENNLIKELRPRYNILMRDDKSYPYIMLSADKKFPRINAYRGVKKHEQHYFGPYPNVSAVKHTIELMQKLFKLRTCTDAIFRNRTRPCLQYQIKRCSAPCVNFISADDYQKSLANAILFLKGKSKTLISTFTEQMQQAAQGLHFEQAAMLRDQIEKLKAIQEQQHVMQGNGCFDVIVIEQMLEQTAINLLNVEDGKLLGTKNTILNPQHENLATILAAFLTQHYLDADKIPHELIVNVEPADADWLTAALIEQTGHSVKIITPQRGEKMQWLALAKSNASQALATHIQNNLSQQQRWQKLTETLQWETEPNRIECFDISHSQGEATVASCVVFDKTGPLKKEYRRFNITDITPGDDYAALHQAITRRYQRLLTNEHTLPDVVVIDGGKGQLQQAIDVFSQLQINTVKLMSISKGPGRSPHYDVLWQAETMQALHLPKDSISLHLIQQIRDEAHRFAITGHKAKRGKRHQHSILEDIEGVGAKRRRELLKVFGGLQGLQQANIDEIAKVPGISLSLAEKIYQYIH